MYTYTAEECRETLEWWLRERCNARHLDPRLGRIAEEVAYAINNMPDGAVGDVLDPHVIVGNYEAARPKWIASGIPRLAPARFRYENHSQDNSILLAAMHGCDLDRLVGWTDIPQYVRHPEDDDGGLMFFNEDWEEVWCHIGRLPLYKLVYSEEEFNHLYESLSQKS